jgi:hypothetical protein
MRRTRDRRVLARPNPHIGCKNRTLRGVGPSLPLDVEQTDDIPVHLPRLVALRDQTCQHPGGYFL